MRNRIAGMMIRSSEIRAFIKLKIKFKTTYQIGDKTLFEQIKNVNRKTLSEVPKWLTKKTLTKSYFNYGVPDTVMDLLNKDVGRETTYTDLIAYYSKKLTKINFLELGVSVGKNFFQLANIFDHATLTAYDIENINDVLADKLQYHDKVEWNAPEKSLRKEKSSLSKFTYNNNNVNYLAGDIWDENSWSKLKGNKFNIIFSDALHDPEALLWEYKMIKKYDLLADDFIFFWDDLNAGLKESFEFIANDLKVANKKITNKPYYLKLNGWLGVNEHQHEVGIISNITLN
jgi:hypothetical protein